MRHAIELTGMHITAGGPKGLRDRMAREVPMWSEIISQIGLKIR